MARSWKRRLPRCLMIGLAFYVAACGTLLHPERRGQPAGRLDPAIVVLDAVGLLLFFVPGVIAFAVDFSNGTIYLPPESAAVDQPLVSGEMRALRIDPAELTSQRLEAIVQEQTGRNVHLQPGDYHVTQVNDVDECTSQRLEELRSEPSRVRVIFRGTSK